MVVYISGQMSGLPREVYTKHFNEAEKKLKAAGCKVINPCKYYWFMKHLPYKVALVLDLFLMCKCDKIYLLEGWLESCGAKVEFDFACATEMLIEYE